MHPIWRHFDKDQATVAKGPEIDLDCTRSNMHVDVILPLRLGVATDRGLGFDHTKFRLFHKSSLGCLFFSDRHFLYITSWINALLALSHYFLFLRCTALVVLQFLYTIIGLVALTTIVGICCSIALYPTTFTK
jgi:hypothetical protein